mmetsp:Transcript_37218/g.118451  ORF Transcript_37218/g.118451 Transcript_37218/m.118451 type:complete len:503 (-) Transcript_37218:65-1573(-)
MAGAPGDLPYWGSIDAMHQFCEAKYVVSTHFAEIWNALSNIPTFILPGLFGLYSTWRVHDVRLRMLWLNMFWVGIGSFLFHMTMRFKCEMLDELPMVTLVLSGVFAKDDTHWTTSGFRKLLVHTLFLTVALVGMYLYISRGDYEIFCAVFTSLTVPALGLAFMCCFRQGGLACRLHLASTVTLSLARVLWELEARLCPPGRGGPLAWLHVPKTGTSLINAIVHTPGLCPGVPPDMVINRTTYCSDCNPTNDGMAGNFRARYEAEEACPGGLTKWANHKTVGDAYDSEYRGHGFAMLRQPEQRLISSYNHNLHDWPRWKRTKSEPRKNPSLREYAEVVQGCFVKMIAGRPREGSYCGEEGQPPQRLVREAKVRLRGLAFVGLTEEWDLSICLFYAMYGGNCTDVAFLNTRPGRGRTAEGEYNASKYLGSWRDRFDGRVYKKAQEVFWQRVEQYGVTRSTCERICENATETRPFALHEKGLAMRLHATFEPEYDWAGRASYIED